MNYYNASGQMDLSDRIAIETGICIGESFKKIAKRLRRHPSTIAHEVKENRTFIKDNYPNGKDCRMARQCTVRNLCGCDEEACNTKCRLCRGVDCTKVCDRYVSVACHRVQQFLFKAMNRRGCRRAYTWNGFVEMLKYYPLAKPKTYYCLY